MIPVSEIQRVIDELTIEYKGLREKSFKDGVSRATVAYYEGKAHGVRRSRDKLKELLPSEPNNPS